MDLQDVSFLVGLLLIPGTFLFANRLLLNDKYFVPVLILVGSLAIVAMFKLNMHEEKKPNFFLFLFCPLYGYLLLRGLLFVFRRVLHRLPNNPSKNFLGTDDGLWADRIFYFLFLTLSLAVPIVMLAVLYGT